jgi:predicted nucleic acid-binding protein
VIDPPVRRHQRLANLFIHTEPHHAQSTVLIRHVLDAGDSVPTSNYVLAELSALMMRPLRVPQRLRLTMLNRIRSAGWVNVAHIDPDLDAASWEYLGSHTDKDYSLVDCSSFILMEKHRLTEVLTEDRHFEQSGFIRLLGR